MHYITNFLNHNLTTMVTRKKMVFLTNQIILGKNIYLIYSDTIIILSKNSTLTNHIHQLTTKINYNGRFGIILN
jgi:hypothetical protein